MSLVFIRIDVLWSMHKCNKIRWKNWSKYWNTLSHSLQNADTLKPMQIWYQLANVFGLFFNRLWKSTWFVVCVLLIYWIVPISQFVVRIPVTPRFPIAHMPMLITKIWRYLIGLNEFKECHAIHIMANPTRHCCHEWLSSSIRRQGAITRSVIMRIQIVTQRM